MSRLFTRVSAVRDSIAELREELATAAQEHTSTLPKDIQPTYSVKLAQVDLVLANIYSDLECALMDDGQTTTELGIQHHVEIKCTTEKMTLI